MKNIDLSTGIARFSVSQLDICLALPLITIHVDFRLNSWSLAHAISTAVSGILKNIKVVAILLSFGVLQMRIVKNQTRLF